MDKPGLSLFLKALKFASLKHTSQRRKAGDIPYINHPIEVAEFLGQAGISDYEVLSAAILHDTVEDTDTTPEELEHEFGKKVRDIVMECSDDKNLSKVQRKRQQISHASETSEEAKLVKICDKLSNNYDLLKISPPNWTPARVNGYFVWSYAVCQQLMGVNENLDKRMNQFFEKVGVNKYSEAQFKQKLEEYYTILGQK